MNQYLIPANSKKSQLILGIFTMTDLWVAIGSAVISLLLMLAIPGDQLYILVIKLLPLATGLLLVLPIPHYHNVLTFLREVLLFIFNEKEYIWKGWCATSDIYGEETRKSTN